MFYKRLTLPEFAELYPELENVEDHKGTPTFIIAKHADYGMVIWVQDPVKGVGLLVSQHHAPDFLEDGAS